MKLDRQMCPVIVLLLALLSGSFATVPAEAASADSSRGRYALVIGNSNYRYSSSVSGVKDAELMARSLAKLGFDTLGGPVRDGGLELTRSRLKELGERIGNASVVIFFFSGHGYQQKGENYLMPVDASVQSESSISLSEVQDVLNRAPFEAVKLVFLDACRTEENLAKDAPQGLNQKKAPSLKNTLYAFAAGPDAVSESGSADGTSPYSAALLRHLREPGLKIVELLDKVSFDLRSAEQLPAFLVNGKLDDFYLQPPVILQAEIENADDSLIVLLNGKIALSGGSGTKADLRLNAGRNDLELLVYNEKALHNGQTWGRTEGWRYELAIRRDGKEIECGGQRCFKDDGERVPFKNGPRHGKVFTVARANLFVSLDSPKVSVEDRDLRVWEKGSEVWAKDQALLDARSLQQLNLSPEDLLKDIDLGRWVFLRPVVAEFLKTGKILGQVVTDPNDTLFTVRGNRELEPFVLKCMTEKRPDRIRDLKTSVQLALNRDPSPFVAYDQGLMTCLQEVGKGSGFKPEDMLISTAVETRRSLYPQ